MPNPKLKILFLCTGNSCRSQMAEGLARALKGDIIEAYSAGIETHGLNPNAIKVMAEIGIDISNHKSEYVTNLMDINFDYVITVCGHANENCPIFLGKAEVIHVGFNDPPALAKELAKQGASEEVQLDCYRKIRDEIRDFVEQLPKPLGKATSPTKPGEHSDAKGRATSPTEPSERSDAKGRATSPTEPSERSDAKGRATSPTEPSERSDAKGRATSPTEPSERSDANGRATSPTEPGLTRPKISSHQTNSSGQTGPTPACSESSPYQNKSSSRPNINHHDLTEKRPS